MAKLHVELVSPEREIWAGEADMVVAKTIEGEMGIMPGHAPVLGLLALNGPGTCCGARRAQPRWGTGLPPALDRHRRPFFLVRRVVC